MLKVEYVTVQDIDGKSEVRKDTGLYYEEDGEYKSIRIDFLENFGTLENYMMTAYEGVDLSEFSKKSQELMKNDDYEGKYVFKLVLKDGKVISHYYTFNGFEGDDEIAVVPVKIPLENQHTIDPTKVVSSSWYYLESNEDTEYIQTKDIIEKV